MFKSQDFFDSLFGCFTIARIKITYSSMKKTILKRFATVMGIAVFAFVLAVPSNSFGNTLLGKKLETLKITLGLDLAGGTELDYRIDLSDAIAQNNDDTPENDVNLDQIAESVRDALERRVNPAGVGEIVVKRSQVDGEEHVLIQMPPSSNVDKAKADAEQDNRLQFFEEDPALATARKQQIANKAKLINASNWKAKVEKLKKEEDVLFDAVDEPRFKDQIADPDFAEKVFALSSGQVSRELIDTKTELAYTVGEDGKLKIDTLPEDITALVKVKAKTFADREKSIPAKASARHILFGYPEATRAPENVQYSSKEEAKKMAEEVFAQLQTEGTGNFTALAQEKSTEPAAQTSGGDLGEFEKGKMVKEFEEAVFGFGTIGLLDTIVETEFGFHIIEVTAFSQEKTETVREPQVTYEVLGWKTNELGWKETELGGAQLEVATVGFNEVGQPTVDLLFNEEGGELFTSITEKIAERTCDQSACRLGIKVGGIWRTQATVRNKIVGNRAQISGDFTFDSAKQLADGLNLGAIDAPVDLSGQSTILPELGEEQLNKSLKAAKYGLLATMIFMLLGYRLGGVVASFALILYAALFIAILKIWPESLGGPIVLSLSGMAGIALSIGLAVDGNILIFERMKEEIKKKKGLHSAVDLGFERAWSAILDSNLTTMITCIILFNLGSSMIKGFAITLIVGTLLSMFTAVTVSRTLLHALLLVKSFQKPWLFGASRKK